MVEEVVRELVQRGVIEERDVLEKPDSVTIIVVVGIHVVASRHSREYHVWVGDWWGELPYKDFARLLEICRTLEKHGYRYRGYGKPMLLEGGEQ